MSHALPACVLVLSGLLIGCRGGGVDCKDLLTSGPNLTFAKCGDGIERRIDCTKTPAGYACTCFEGAARGRSYASSREPASGGGPQMIAEANQHCGWQLRQPLF